MASVLFMVWTVNFTDWHQEWYSLRMTGWWRSHIATEHVFERGPRGLLIRLAGSYDADSSRAGLPAPFNGR